MFIQGNQRAELERGDFTQQDGVSRTVAFKYFERYHMFQGLPDLYLIAIFLLNHFAGFAKRQRFGLREKVRQQLRMVIGQRVMGDRRSDKVAKTILVLPGESALMHTVLTVCARLRPR